MKCIYVILTFLDLYEFKGRLLWRSWMKYVLDLEEKNRRP